MFSNVVASHSSSAAHNDGGGSVKSGKLDRLAALIVLDNDDMSMTLFAALLGVLAKVDDMIDMTGVVETADETADVVAREFTTAESVMVTVGVVDTGEVIGSCDDAIDDAIVEL